MHGQPHIRFPFYFTRRMNIITLALCKYEYENNFEIGLNTKRTKTKTHDVFTFYDGVDTELFFFRDGLFSQLPQFLPLPQHIQPLFCSHLHYFFILLIVYLLLHGFPFTRLIRTTFNVTLKDASA